MWERLLLCGTNVSGWGPQSTETNVEGKNSGLWKAMCPPIDLLWPSGSSFFVFGEQYMFGNSTCLSVDHLSVKSQTSNICPSVHPCLCPIHFKPAASLLIQTCRYSTQVGFKLWFLSPSLDHCPLHIFLSEPSHTFNTVL